MSQRFTIPSLQATLAKRSKPTLQPNFAKEPFGLSRSNLKTADAQETKNGASIGVKCLIVNKAQYTARNIRKLGNVGKSKFCTFIQNCKGLISWSFELPASAYCHR